MLQNNLLLSICLAGVVLLTGCARKARPDADADFYLEVSDLPAKADDLAERVVQVRGFVAAGSLTTGSFVLEEKGTQLPVRYSGPRPDTLKDRAEVVARGRLVRDGDGWVLDAHEVLAKCPSRYDSGKPVF